MTVPDFDPETNKNLVIALLKQCDESRIVETLLYRAYDASTQEVDTLKSLLEDAIYNNPPRLHCVRCHKEYMYNANGPSKCQIPHSDKHGVARVKDDE
ncbi:hypothetical protein FRC07_003231, partial [Ceratobasidium sp. 392]